MYSILHALFYYLKVISNFKISKNFDFTLNVSIEESKHSFNSYFNLI